MDETAPNKAGRNGRYRILIFILLMVNWVVFSGKLDPVHLTYGLISCSLVTYLSAEFLFSDRRVAVSRRMIQAVRFMTYSIWLLWQIILSNFHLLKLSLIGRRSLSPQIVRYECKLDSDFEKFLLANSITLTPGTVTMKIIGQTYYIHAISDLAAQGLDGEMERRIAKIFA